MTADDRSGHPGAREIPARYSRQVLFAGLGTEGQGRIVDSRVVLVGCGALGTFQASMLVRAGVGMVRIIDRDFVEESNLQRQILFDEDDARNLVPKAVAAETKLKGVNSRVEVEGLVEDVNASTADRLLGGFDLILDASDNFDVRYLVNDYSVKTATPWIYGACVGSYGLMFPILPGEGACLRCVFEDAPAAGVAPSCDTAGVIGPIVGAVASLQAAEAFKILSGRRDRIDRRIRTLDLWENRHDAVALPPRNPECICCGQRRFEYLDGTLGADATTLCGRNSVQIRPRSGGPVDLAGLALRLSPLGAVCTNRFLLRATIDNHQITIFRDGRAIIGGTHDHALAKSLYARYVGA